MTENEAAYQVVDGFVKRTAAQREKLFEQAYVRAANNAPVTLRQLFYLLVNAGWLAKIEQEYAVLGGLLTRKRRAGDLPWEWVIDSSRRNRVVAQWDSPSHALRSIAEQYRRSVWKDQPSRVYIGVEKEALAGVMQPVCDEYGVTLIVTRGYPSATYMNDLAEEFADAWRHVDSFESDAHGRGSGNVHLFYYGDHDPRRLSTVRFEVFARRLLSRSATRRGMASRPSAQAFRLAHGDLGFGGRPGCRR